MTLIRDGDSGQLQARPREMAEVAVMRNEGRLMVDARLGNEHIGEFCLVTRLDQARPQASGAMPEVLVNLQDWQTPDVVDECRRKSWITEHFAQYGRRQRCLPVDHRTTHEIDVAAGITGEKPA